MAVKKPGRPRAGAPPDGSGEEEKLSKFSFKADRETAAAIDYLTANTPAATKVARRRLRSEAIRRALLAAAAAEKAERAAREKNNCLSGSDSDGH